MKHNLTFNWTYDLPFAKNSRGVRTAGVISSTVTRPRQIQFGLKFMY